MIKLPRSHQQTNQAMNMTEKTRIEIALLLPAVPDARDACVQRLGDLLRANDGIEAAHLTDTNGQRPGEICIHYDPDRLSIGEVRDLARRAGAELEKRFGHLLLKTEPMHARRAQMVESRARQIAGVLEAAASPAGVLRIEFDRQAADEAAIRAAVRKFGVRIIEVAERSGRSPNPSKRNASLPGKNTNMRMADCLASGRNWFSPRSAAGCCSSAGCCRR